MDLRGVETFSLEELSDPINHKEKAYIVHYYDDLDMEIGMEYVEGTPSDIFTQISNHILESFH